MANQQNTVNPLDWKVPIVNADGTPTNEFMRKWAQQARTNGNIPDLSTAAGVSEVLDKIAATAQSILVRGTAQWGGLTAPGDASKFLNGANPPAFAQAKDSDLAFTDITTNDTSTTKHGFMPKLPGGSTNFFREDGTWAAPPGGGGGGGSSPLALLIGADGHGSPNSLSGNYISVLSIAIPADGSLTGVGMLCNTTSATANWAVAVYADAGGTPGALLAQSAAQVGLTAGTVASAALTTPQTVTKGQIVWLAFWGDTNYSTYGGSTNNNRIFLSHATSTFVNPFSGGTTSASGVGLVGYLTSATGGSGNGSWAWPNINGTTSGAPSAATYGCLMTPYSDLTVTEMSGRISLVTGATYQGAIYTVDASGTILTVAATGTVVAASITGAGTLKLPIASTLLTAGTRYALVITRTDGTDTTAALLYGLATSSLPIWPAAPFTDGNAVSGRYCYLAKKAPIVGDTFTSGNGAYSVAIRYNT